MNYLNFNQHKELPLYHSLSDTKASFSHNKEVEVGDSIRFGTNDYTIVSIDQKKKSRGMFPIGFIPDFYKVTIKKI